jgi:hypothetical protein
MLSEGVAAWWVIIVALVISGKKDEVNNCSKN